MIAIGTLMKNSTDSQVGDFYEHGTGLDTCRELRESANTGKMVTVSCLLQ